MKTYELTVPCHFGLESVLKKEIYDLGYEISEVEDGRLSLVMQRQSAVQIFFCVQRSVCCFG